MEAKGKSTLSETIAQWALNTPGALEVLRRLCRFPLSRHLGAGSLAHAITRVAPAGTIGLAPLNGFDAYVDISEYLGMVPFFFGDTGVPAVILEGLPAEAVCLDIGASHGFFTLSLRARLGKGCRIFSFEPQPEKARLLRRSVERNRWQSEVKVEMKAAADQPQESVTLFLSNDPHNSGQASLAQSPEHRGAQTHRVESVRLDDYLREHGVHRVDFIKIDVEEFEFAVLQGLGRILEEKKVRSLFVETRAGSDADRLLRETGYEAHLVDSRGIVVPHEKGTFGNFTYRLAPA